jgi:hypothetical protein
LKEEEKVVLRKRKICWQSGIYIVRYDKLKSYGLCISSCMDGFSRKMNWPNVYHTNNDPRVIGGYFLQAVAQYGGCPLSVRVDFGLIEVCHCKIRCTWLQCQICRRFTFIVSQLKCCMEHTHLLHVMVGFGSI